MNKKLLITFDYELYLGNKSGSVEECMIIPTNKLLSILNKYSVHSIFFVDTTYLVKLKEKSVEYPECDSDLNIISKQLIKLVNDGHYVFPHIHSHWLDAVYLPELNQWSLNKIDKYRFHRLTDTEKEEVFNKSIQCLSDILNPTFPEYKIDGFRAGGWCIQPFTDYKPFFLKNKIFYEFSVLGGVYQFTDAQYFDFSNAPKKNIYKFNDDVCIENSGGSFHEFNISTMKVNSFTKLMNKIWSKFYFKLSNDHTFNKGQGQRSNSIQNNKPSHESGIDLSDGSLERLAVELMTTVKLKNYTNYLNEYDYMHIISHPKMITNHNLKMFSKFLKTIYQHNNIETDFRKMLLN